MARTSSRAPGIRTSSCANKPPIEWATITIRARLPPGPRDSARQRHAVSWASIALASSAAL